MRIADFECGLLRIILLQNPKSNIRTEPKVSSAKPIPKSCLQSEIGNPKSEILNAMETKNYKINLSEREYEVMERVSCGRQNKEIADDLDCMTNTIRKHLQHIYPKLRVQNRTEASIKFMEITGKLKTVIE